MVTLAETQMPSHTHTLSASEEDGTQGNPATNTLPGAGVDMYSPPSNLTSMSSQMLPETGGSQSHNNLQPFLAINFIIALVGLYPSRS